MIGPDTTGAGPAVDPRSIRRLSRAISIVEDQAEGHADILAAAYRAPALSRVIGVTGPPGAGKSTLVDALTQHWVAAGEAVAVLAVDPSSPFSGGAVLGDRVRMDRSADLPGVYVRSLSARGQGGGLSAGIGDVLAVLNQAGFRRVLLETVGAGQADLAVADAADCTLVVGVPGLGDAIQASKAGMMEVGDVYVVNKADRPGADATVHEIDAALAVAYPGPAGVSAATAIRRRLPQSAGSAGRRALLARHGDPERDPTLWRPPVLPASATAGDGIAALAAAIDAFLDWCAASGRLDLRRRSRIRWQVLQALGAVLLAPYRAGDGDAAAALAAWVDRILDGQASPIEAAADLIAG